MVYVDVILILLLLVCAKGPQFYDHDNAGYYVEIIDEHLNSTSYVQSVMQILAILPIIVRILKNVYFY